MADLKSKQNLLEHSEKQGGSTVNRALQNELANILSKDRSFDLSSWLVNTPSLYSINRAKAIDFSLRKAKAATEQHEGSGDAPNPSPPSMLSKKLHSIQDLEVIRPLDASVLIWAEGAGLRSFPRETDQKLHDLIARYEVIDNMPGSVVVGLSPSIALKVCPRSRIGYLDTYEYIIKHVPQIPVASLLGVLTTENLAYTFMQRMHGVALDKLWSRLNMAEKEAIRQQLIEPFKLLRAIPKPFSGFAFGTGHPPRCIDVRRYVRESTEQVTTESEFNRFLVKMDPTRSSPLLDLGFRSLREDHEIVMTHGDLHPRNIMVSRQGDESIKLEAILDWEASGWYPAYWEYVKTLHTICAAEKTLDWCLSLPTEAIGFWGAEYAIDRLIDRFF